MAQTRPEHPSESQLRAFGLGTLQPDEQRRVERHIRSCDPCCEFLAGLPRDTLLNRLKGCETLVPDSTAGGKTAEDPEAIPPELSDHPRYRIAERLGGGGMGVVYRAEHRLMHRAVAVKVVQRRLLNSAAAVKRFQTEVRAAAQLAHPNIVTAYDAEQAGAWHLLVMEYVEGVNLAEHVRRKGPLSVAEACGYARQVALGLQHAHEQGMVHRDIKPQNLMLTRDGQIKILDFGLACFASEATVEGQQADTRLTGSGMMLGTPDYVAPEQILDARTADIRADIYGLGCTLYFLLTGAPPFSEGTAMQRIRGHLQHPPQPLSERRPESPVKLARVVDKMLRKEPGERFQTPGEVTAALAPFCNGRPLAIPPPPPPARVPRRREPAAPPNALPRVVANGSSRERRGASKILRWEALGGGIAALLLLIAAAVMLFSPAATQGPQRILLVIPYRSFWWPDYDGVRRHLEQAKYVVQVASSRPGRASAATQDSPGPYAPVPVDLVLSEANPEDYDAVVFTGAWPFEDMEFVHDPSAAAAAADFIDGMSQRGKLVTAICVGTAVLARSGVLDGQEAAWNQYLPVEIAQRARIRMVTDRPVTRVGKTITACRPEDGEALVAELRKAFD